MNQIPYYAEWWNRARTNPGTVLTKPKRHQRELAQKDYQIQLLQNANGILEVEHFPLREEIARLEGVIGEWEERYNELESLNTHEITQFKKQIKALTILAEDRKQRLEQEQTALITLAKQKIANKKQATELLNQLENNWNQDREAWTQEKKELETQHHTETEQLNQAWKEKRNQSKKTWTAKEKQWKADYQLAQEENKNLKTQLTQAGQRELNLNQIQRQQEQRINHLQAELNQAQSNLTQTQEKAQQESQVKQEQINILQQEKLTRQGQITQLTQELTQKTQTIAEQLTQINTQTTQLTRQNQVLNQLLTNREERLQELGGQND